ncbi:transcription initiation factor TFIIB [Acrasis kona]|uniref:Transcription initiation factor IIB n=1 Tax=Acrasis kona TaxID=1008807 RepID=A0AAW2YV88_9EUKA
MMGPPAEVMNGKKIPQNVIRAAMVEYVQDCPTCSGANIIEDHAQGTMICTDCGTVVADHIIDMDSEWRNFESDSGEKDKSRVGSAQDPLLDGMDHLTTVINAGAGGKGGEYARAHFKATVNTSDKNLRSAFQRIDQMGDRIDLPERYRGRVKEIYKKMDDAKALKGKPQDAMIAACIYMGTRLDGVPRTLKEIVALSEVPKKDIGRCYKIIQKTLNLQAGTVCATNYMTRFCSHLELPPYIEAGAEEVSTKATELPKLSGKSPITVAAASIFMVSSCSQHKKTAKEIADVTGVSESTIRNCVKEMEPYRTQLLPKRFLDYVDNM